MDPVTFPLCPVDYVFTGVGSVPITFAFFFSKALDPVPLRKGLGETLPFFPLLSSRLARNGETEYVYHLHEHGPEFELLESDQAFGTARHIGRYIQPVNSVEGNPLSRIILTQIPDGSVLAVSISHALVDGFSYFHFLSSWARACRGERFLPPDLNREGVFPAPVTGAESVSGRTLLDHCGLFLGNPRDPNADTAREERIFLPKDRLRALLEEAKRDCPGPAFSENDAVTAWLWKTFLPRWIEGPGDADVHVTCPVDCRRIYKPLPRQYLGCALSFASASADKDSLDRAPLGELALRVNAAVRGVGNDFVARSWRTLEQFRRSGGLTAMQKIHLRHPARGLIVTNLTRMPLRDLDFGTGAPADFLIHSDVSGSAALLPAVDGIEAVVLHPARPL
jgi:hypothetical protein